PEAELLAALAEARAATRYPDAAIEKLRTERRVDVAGDGSYVETIRDVTRILNKRGQEGWSEGSEGYDSRNQDLHLDWARTLAPGGKILAVAPNAVKDTAPFADYPSYDVYRLKTWTFPATEPGAVVDYRATLRARRPMLEKDFADVAYLGQFQPTRHLRYTVSLPKGRPLYHLVRHARPEWPVSFSRREAGQRVEYTWEVRDIGYTLTEANMPPSLEVLPSVWVTTQPSWEAVGAWWRRVNAGKAKPSPRIRALAAKLTRGLDSPEDKARAIYHWVVRNIRYVYVDMNYTGYETQSADDVLEAQYGDCKGGSTLLLALLAAAGIKAHHALIRTSGRGPVVKESPSVYQFNHCIVAAELPGGLTFLDNVGKTVRFGTLPAMDQGTLALVVKPDGQEFAEVPLGAAPNNERHTRRIVELDPAGGATVSVMQTFSGLQDSASRGTYQALSPTRMREHFEARVADEATNARLLSFHVSDPEDLGTPLEVRYSYRAADLADRAGDLLIFRIPGYAPDMESFERESRTFPMWWDSLAAHSQRSEIKLPPGYRVRHVPATERVALPQAQFHGSYEPTGDGRIVFDAATRFLARDISTEAYAPLRDLVRRRALFGKGLIVLEKR
ncbi:MAG: DUF3857 domain-containing protein, partial [Candidatus Sericytochromatia bacterium]|nr:DUF3857 domain-containing protein [Candidatus Tanganyikabacteria bacterium]